MHSTDNHRHCVYLTGSTHKILSDFLRLSQHLGRSLICAYDVTAYDTLLSHPESNTVDEKHAVTRTFKQARQELGSTHDAVLLDLTQGISASTVAILAGTVRGGGLFAIALPEEDWLAQPDQDLSRYLPFPYEPKDVSSYFKRFFLNRLHNLDPTQNQASPFVTYDSMSFQSLPSLLPIEQNAPLTQEQNNAQAQLLSQVRQQSQAKRRTDDSNQHIETLSYVLIAARGRGKSTLLGDSIAKLMLAGKRVVVTAPNQDAILSLTTRFDQVMALAGEPHTLPFYAPDALLATDFHGDYLFVDEAAMIPVPLLIALNLRAEKCVFSTTDYGYEGAGKGFGIRFCRHLSEQDTPLTQLTLQHPIRWGDNDPLEAWVNECFFLAPPCPEECSHKQSNRQSNNHSDKDNETAHQLPNACPTRPEHKQISGKEWLENTDLLARTFNLLVSAHYQTKPDNLRWMLDDPSVSTFLSLDADILLSVAIMTEEGELPDELSRHVMQGTRRPRGHLLPQSLLAHEGIESAGNHRYWRISRIATNDGVQRQNHASNLLKHIESAAIQQGVDFLSTSFAATLDTLNFWQKNGFFCVRLGTSKDQSSGSYSIMMVKPLHSKAKTIAHLWHQYYLANLTINLPKDYRDIELALAEKLRLSAQPQNCLSDKEQRHKDRHDLMLFAHHHRPYLTIRAQLTRFIQDVVQVGKLNPTHPQHSLFQAVIQHSAADMDFAMFGLTTKKQIEKHLKQSVKTLLAEKSVLDS